MKPFEEDMREVSISLDFLDNVENSCLIKFSGTL